MLDQFDAERRNAARAVFDREAKQGGAKLRWDDLGDEPVVEGFAARALLADLLVLGQPDRDDPFTAGVPADFVESVLIASGKPALVIPYAGTFTGVGNAVLIAWKPTREAAHAVAAALPLIRGAGAVHVVTPVGATDAPADSFPGLMGYLREHGVEAEIRGHRAAPDESGEGVLSLAADVQADLLVMGCYGHSRARELVLGGASRTIMRSMTLPVLMSH
jgi:nucleotide-binding universal stress UspA family protein